VTAEERLAIAFITEHPDEAARLLERVDASDAAAVMASVPAPVGADVMRTLAPSSAAACAAALGDAQLAAIVDHLALDDAAAILRTLDASRRQALLAHVAEDRREPLRVLLSFPENTAGAVADPLALALPEDITVADAQKQMRGSDQHLFYYLYVVRRDRTLVGALALPELMAARPKDTLGAVMRTDLVRLDANLDLATVVAHPAWRDLDAMPVVDTAGRLVGAIRHKTMRQLSGPRVRPMSATIAGLSELYWVGMSGMIASLAPQAISSAEDDDVSR
jgi:magnesium transporter